MFIDQALADHSAIPINLSRIDTEDSGALNFELGVVGDNHSVGEEVMKPLDGLRGLAEIPIPSLGVGGGD